MITLLCQSLSKAFVHQEAWLTVHSICNLTSVFKENKKYFAKTIIVGAHWKLKYSIQISRVHGTCKESKTLVCINKQINYILFSSTNFTKFVSITHVFHSKAGIRHWNYLINQFTSDILSRLSHRCDIAYLNYSMFSW